MSKAAIAAGADSLMIEVHPNPAKALSDGPQSLTPKQYEELMLELAVIGKTVGRPERAAQLTQVSTESAVSHLIAANL